MSDVMIDVEDMIASGTSIDAVVSYVMNTLRCTKEYAERIVKDYVTEEY